MDTQVKTKGFSNFFYDKPEWVNSGLQVAFVKYIHQYTDDVKSVSEAFKKEHNIKLSFKSIRFAIYIQNNFEDFKCFLNKNYTIKNKEYWLNDIRKNETEYSNIPYNIKKYYIFCKRNTHKNLISTRFPYWIDKFGAYVNCDVNMRNKEASTQLGRYLPTLEFIEDNYGFDFFKNFVEKNLLNKK